MICQYLYIAQLAQHYKNKIKTSKSLSPLPMKKPNPKTQFQKLLQSNNISQTSHKFPSDTDIPQYRYIECSTKNMVKLKKYISNKYLSSFPQSKSCLQIKQGYNKNFIIHCFQKHYIGCRSCCNFYMKYRYDNDQHMFVLVEYQNVHVHYQMSVNMKDVQLLARRLKINSRNIHDSNIASNATMVLRSYNTNNNPGFEDQIQHELEEELSHIIFVFNICSD